MQRADGTGRARPGPDEPTRVAEPIQDSPAILPSGNVEVVNVAAGTGRPSGTGGGFARDFSWSRIGSARAGNTFDVEAYADHPRLGGVSYVPGLQASSALPTPSPAAAPIDWNMLSVQTLNGTPAIYTVSQTTQDATNDRLYGYIKGTVTSGATTLCGSCSLLAGYSNIYSTPSLVWYLQLDSTVNGSYTALDYTGKKVYAVTSGALPASTKLTAKIIATDTIAPVSSTAGFPTPGTLQIEMEQMTYTGSDLTHFTGLTRGVNSTTAASHNNNRAVAVPNNGATLWFVDAANSAAWALRFGSGKTVQWSSPWVDFANNRVYVGDEQGDFLQADVSGAVPSGNLWSFGTGSAIHSTPLVYNGILYVGDDGGHFRVVNVGTGSGTPTVLNNWAFGAGAKNQLWATPYLDVTNGRMIIPQDNGYWTLNNAVNCPLLGSCVAPTFTAITGVATGTRFQSSPLVDPNTSTATYFGKNNSLIRCAYSAAGGVGTCGGASNVLALQMGVDASYPRSSPSQYPGNNDVYIGDGGGYMNRITPGASLAAHTPFRLTSGLMTTSVDSSVVFDFGMTTGNIYYSAATNSASTPGAYIQLPQTF